LLNTDTLIQARNLACERGGVRIFENLSFTLHKGQCLELRGPNGAGKSSLLRVLAGFIEPATGTLEIAEQSCQYIAHSDAIKLVLSTRENIAFWQGLSGGDIGQVLKAFSLEALADHPALFLSQGQRRRLALSRLVLTHRPIWLLDEPTNGLDTASLGTLHALMINHLSTGGAIITATHVDLGLPHTTTLQLEGRS
jgi:heme exporter protein A